MNAGMPSKIRFAASRFSASAPRRFLFQSFCKAVAAFCNGEFSRVKNQAALRAGSPLLPSTKHSISGLRRAAIWLSHAAPVLGIFRNVKRGVRPPASVPGTEHDGTQRCPAQPPRRLLRRENHPQSWASCFSHCSIMKKAFVRLSLALLALIGLAFMAGVIHPITAAVAVVAVQAVMFTVSVPQSRLFISALSSDQVQEFEEILRGLKSELERYKGAPDRFDKIEKTLRNLEDGFKTIQRSMLSRSLSGLTRPKGGVSDECARGLAAAVILNASSKGKLEGVIRGERERTAILNEARTFFKEERSLSTDEIPLPTTYGTELVELIEEFGIARKEMFMYPMNGGQNRPPRWHTRPTFGSIVRAAQADEKKIKIEFCDLTSRKLGGIVIVPTEIEQQSLLNWGRLLAQYGAIEFARAEDHWAFNADGGEDFEGVEGIFKIASDNNKAVVLGAGKTKPSDAVLEDFRAMRRKVSTAALSGGAYYLNQSWEGALRNYNTVNEKVFDYRPDGTATLDGFPIRWTEVLQPHQDTAAAAANLAVFGRLKFWLFGHRGVPRIDRSADVYFVYDMVATRFLEELDFDYLSLNAASVLKTAAS